MSIIISMFFRNRILVKTCMIAFVILLLFSFWKTPDNEPQLIFPYKEMGLSEKEAAAHLLNRFSFGATPAQVEMVVRTGLEKWFLMQLEGNIPDDSLNKRLQFYDALKLSNAQANAIFPRPIQVIRMARDEGIIPKDSANDNDRKKYKQELAGYIKQKNFRRQQDLFRQFISSKILRASYSENQLQEVMVDFWFNHFNVSFSKKDCAVFIPAYERDVIRPNTTGKFEDLLLATAKSPAMLLYLDNFMSNADVDNAPNSMKSEKRIKRLESRLDSARLEKMQKRRKNKGLNENYAREVMELHTMGVDGGYTQEDVTQAARILTGWTLYPIENSYGSGLKKTMQKIGDDKLSGKGFFHDGDFLFAMNNHDISEKKVLGKTFTAGGGYEEGVSLFKMLANHPSTAKFISGKLAVRFVADEPPASLVDKMANTFLKKNGHIKEVLLTMVSAKEFWSRSVVRGKTKSPFEVVISSVRTLQADLQQPYQLFSWMDKMGQKIYHYNAPTGFPDKAAYWINTGALLSRMNFGLSISNQQIRGINVQLLKLNDFHEPESPLQALETYSKLILPERDLTSTLERLTPLLTQPSLDEKVAAAENKAKPQKASISKGDETEVDEMMDEDNDLKIQKQKKSAVSNAAMLAQVVGIILGSPEFQRK